MAFKKPNFTQIPNEFFELVKDLSDVEIRVLLHLFRITYGWHAEHDPFTVSRADLADPTGLSQPGVKKGLLGLVEKAVITRQTREGLPSVYRLNIEGNPDTPVSDPQQEPGHTCIRESDTPVADQPVLTTSLGNKKESISPTPLTPDAEEPLIDYLHSLARHGRQKPVFNPKELAYLRERDSPEMRAMIAERVEASDAANIREVILAAVGYTGRKAPERKGYNRAAPRQASNGLARAFEALRTFDRAPPTPQRVPQWKRVSDAKIEEYRKLGILEEDDDDDEANEEKHSRSSQTGRPTDLNRVTQ